MIVREWQKVVVLRDGAVQRVLGAGRHRVRRRREEALTVDLRLNQLTVPLQEITAADGVPVKVSVALQWRVTDAVTYLTKAQAPLNELYLAVQLALRGVVAGAEHTAVQEAADAALPGAVADAAAAVGVEVLTAKVKDVVLPGELRRAATDLIAIREQGKRDLEKARSEAASLRSLANTARLLQEHPALLELRVVQAAERPGATVVLRNAKRPD